MASTSLFAPQVRATQPAFAVTIENEVQSGEVKIYFSISAYNSIDDIKGVLITVEDPSKASAWSKNSMLRDFEYYFIEKEDFNSTLTNSEEYVITLSLNDNIFKNFTLNRFYQAQLYLVEANATNFNATQNWIQENKDKISVPSIATLIRPISNINNIIIDGLTNLSNISPLKEIKGNITYADDSKIELVSEVGYRIYNSDDIVIYDSKYTKNVSGLSFSIPVDYYLPIGNYKLELYFRTINGYEKTDTKRDFTIVDEFEEPTLIVGSISIKESAYLGGILVEGVFPPFAENKDVILYRSSRKTDYTIWKPVYKVTVSSNSIYNSLKWIDREVVEKGCYKYVFKAGSQVSAPTAEIKVTGFEDIYLADKDTMFAVKYNPKISNFKWVVQEAITNVLGSKFPFVRRNGDIKYRQFNLSGTLYFEDTFQDEDGIDSCGRNFFFDNESNLYCRLDSDKLDNFKKVTLGIQKRNYIMDFLTNGTFKLFKSTEEGYMIVYLSNVSFTPNITLGRQVYDFSATVTEVIEASEENLEKYFKENIDINLKNNYNQEIISSWVGENDNFDLPYEVVKGE